MNIVLIHGLGRTRFSMAMLGWRLRRQGHQIHSFGYAAWREPFDQIAQRLVQTIGPQIGSAPYVLVGHSLGNIIVRAALPALSDRMPQQLMMLAPPNQPPLLARLLRGHPLFQAFTRDCGQRLADGRFYQNLPIPTIRTTIFAGTAGPRGRLSPFGDLLNDGVVAVEETRLRPGGEVIKVPSIHTLIMNSSEVTQRIVALL